MSSKRNRVGGTRQHHGAAAFAGAVAEFLAECPAEISRRTKPEGFGNFDNAPPVRRIAKRNMGLQADISQLRSRGLRPLALAFSAFLFIGCFSLMLVKLV